MDTYASGAFFDGYIECAVWASYTGDDGGTPLDSVDCELSTQLLADSARDCEGFCNANEADVTAYAERFGWDCAGHDFFLTRNHHGAGFWDRVSSSDPLYEACERLSGASHVYGSADLYLGDDGKVYV